VETSLRCRREVTEEQFEEMSQVHN
jgi:hypothetical protein